MAKEERAGDETIGIMGLTYKPNTDVVEEAFGLLLAQELSAANLPVIVYDPLADVKHALRDCNGLRCAKGAEECIDESGVVVLATPWPKFAQVPAARWARPNSPRVVIDCWRALGHLSEANGVRYVRLGYGVPGTNESRSKTQARG